MNILMLILLVVMTFVAGVGVGLIIPALLTMRSEKKKKTKDSSVPSISDEETRRRIRQQAEFENMLTYDGTEQDDIKI